MNNDITMPTHLLVLGEEARRLRELLAQGLASTPLWSEPAPRFHDLISHSLNRLQAHISALIDIVNGALQTEASNPDGDGSVMHRVAGRIEQVLVRMVNEYQTAQNAALGFEHAYPKQLLVEAHHDILLDIDAWLSRIVDVVENPETYVSDQSLAADGNIELPISLILDCPPAITELGNWCESRSAELQRASLEDEHGINFDNATYTSSQGPGFWSTVGTIALGFFVGGALLGDDCDE